jgi:acylphosphatase
MTIRERIKKWKNNYVIRQVDRIILPEFNESDVERYSVEFSGRVQKVGFRLEIYLLAKKLELKGFVENLADGKVLMEAQGEKNRIEFLIEFMKRLKRARVKNISINNIKKVNREDSFIIKE